MMLPSLLQVPVLLASTGILLLFIQVLIFVPNANGFSLFNINTGTGIHNNIPVQLQLQLQLQQHVSLHLRRHSHSRRHSYSPSSKLHLQSKSFQNKKSPRSLLSITSNSSSSSSSSSTSTGMESSSNNDNTKPTSNTNANNNTNNNTLSNLKERLLKISNIASMLCVIDCTVLPIVTILLPLVGLGASAAQAKWIHELGHSVALFFVLPGTYLILYMFECTCFKIMCIVY